MTTSFGVSALPPADLDRVRTAGVDDFGNELVVMTNTDDGHPPLRCCLRDAAAGDRYALIAWQPAPVGSAYAEVGPVFIHADRCEGYPDARAYPEGFRHRSQLFRSYDAKGWQVDNQIVEGSDAEGAIEDLFARPEVAYIHSRNMLPGCYMFTISRAGAT